MEFYFFQWLLMIATAQHFAGPIRVKLDVIAHQQFDYEAWRRRVRVMEGLYYDEDYPASDTPHVKYIMGLCQSNAEITKQKFDNARHELSSILFRRQYQIVCINADTGGIAEECFQTWEKFNSRLEAQKVADGYNSEQCGGWIYQVHPYKAS